MTTPRYSKRHYEDVAKIIGQYVDPSGHIDTPERAVFVFDAIRKDFADLFADDNPRFDRDRFLAACGLEGEG